MCIIGKEEEEEERTG